MKKFTKIMLGGGLACTLIGCLIIFTAVLSGGREKVSQLIYDGAFTVNIGRATFPFWSGNVSFFDWDDHDWNHTYNKEDEEFANQSKSVKDVTDMKIEIGGGKLTIKKDEAYTEYEVKIKGTNRYQTSIKNGCLTIEPIESIQYINNKTAITIYMPADAKINSLELCLGGGVADLRDITSDFIDIDLGAGSLEVDGISGSKFSCEMGAGELMVKNADVNELEMEVAMGKASFQGVIKEAADVKCSMGVIDLKIDGKYEDFNYDLDCAMGTLSLEGSNFAAGMGTEKVINNGVNKEIDVECDMGTVNVSFR